MLIGACILDNFMLICACSVDCVYVNNFVYFGLFEIVRF